MSLRLAVWSGPRNISTAMMRAWENRPDTVVVDEPLYAHYLSETGLDHPGREAIIAAGEPDWRRVATAMTGPIPDGAAIHYQKHMTHHMLPTVDLGWLGSLTHAFLIRDPREVLLSYIRTRPAVTAEDIGVPRQAELYAHVIGLGARPVVIDGSDFLRDPEGQLRAWCAALGVEFLPEMLAWPAGPRDSDGVWAPYWYDAVIASTGFEPWRQRDRRVPPEHRAVIDACMPLYEALYARRLQT